MDAGPPARRPSCPGRALRRRRGPRRITVFVAVASGMARAWDLATAVRRARRGPWRAEIAEASMTPALLPGDWLLLDPTCRRWPRPGSIVVVREPDGGALAIKRVAAHGRRGRSARSIGAATLPEPGAGAPPPKRQGLPPLGPREAWVLGDAGGVSRDSRAYGPLDADALVARAWFRYGPPRRIGRLR